MSWRAGWGSSSWDLLTWFGAPDLWVVTQERGLQCPQQQRTPHRVISPASPTPVPFPSVARHSSLMGPHFMAYWLNTPTPADSPAT